MTPRPKLRQTARTRNAVLFYQDRKRLRFVVYRRAKGITRKTSVRYTAHGNDYWGVTAACRLAENMARRLKAWPADKLASFQF